MATHVNIPATGSGDAGPIPVATVDDLSGNKHQQFVAEFLTAGVPTSVDATHQLPVTAVVTSNALPTGASTETTLAAVNTKLGSALPLPTGASTETTVAAINTKLGSALPLPTGAATETTLAAVNTKLGSALPLPTGAATQTSLAAAVTELTAIVAQLPAALGAHGGLVVEGVASGVAIPVTGGGTPTDQQQTTTFSTPTTSTPITGLNGISTVVVEVISGASNTATGVTWGVQGSQDGTNWETLSWMTTTALVYNAAGTGISNITGLYYFLAAGMAQVRINVAAIASGNFPTNLRTTSGFIMPRQTTVGIVGAIPAGTNAIGSLTAGAAIVGKVGIDQTTPGTTNNVTSSPVVAGTATLTQVAGSASTGTIIAANASRKAAVIVNDSTATLYIAFAATATTGAYTYKLASQATLELPTAGRAIYQGLISGIWSAAAGNAVVTDMS